jgi:hypothetical protein
MGLRLTKTNMKLYATTTSERASKGQGGKWIEIEVKDENKEIIAIMKFSTPPEGVKDKTLLGYWFSDELLKVEIKGNKQKDEHIKNHVEKIHDEDCEYCRKDNS